MVVSVANQNADGDKINNENLQKSLNFSSALLSVDCLQVLSQFEGHSLGGL